jgi:serine/threonine-protein kinase
LIAPAELVGVLGIDQWQRWRAGERIPAEDYLRRYPAVETDSEQAVELIYGEFLVREDLGERPQVEEYLQRFSSYAEQLREQFHLHRELEADSNQSDASSPGPSIAPTLEQPQTCSPFSSPVGTRLWPAVTGYEILEELGRGGMGVVYKARQMGLNRLVALKFMRWESDASTEERARFHSEAMAVARLQHSNVVQIYEVGEQEGRSFLSLEFLEGGSLARQLDGTPRPARAAGGLVETLARAVHAAHRVNIVHRDLKPGNVLLTTDGTPKIADFGLAKLLDGDRDQTGSGVILGTPSYMAPEQAEGKIRAIGPATDVYALGALLYELVTGRPPFRAETAVDTVRQVVADEPVPPSRLNPKLPRDLETICLKCLHKEPHKRYGSAQELADDLRRWQAGESIRARPIGPGERAVKWVRRKPMSAGLLVAVVLAAVGSGWALWEQVARRAELAERVGETKGAVDLTLTRVEELQKQAAEMPTTTNQERKDALVAWQRATDTMAEAEAALRTGAAEDLTRQRVADVRRRLEQRLIQEQRKLLLLHHLDEARLLGVSWNENTFDHAGAVRKYREAFAAYDYKWTPGRAAEFVQRIRAEEPDVRNALIVALDDWAYSTTQAYIATQVQSQPSARELQSLAADADDDGLRQRYRAFVAARDWAALRDLSAEARRASFPPSTLVLLAMRLYQHGAPEEALSLLRWARSRHPADFWIHLDLAAHLRRVKAKTPTEVEEMIGCYRAALALRPANGVVHNNLGVALKDRNQVNDAIAEYERAIQLDPQYATAHNNLGNVLKARNRMDDAITEYRKAIELDPMYSLPHYNLANALKTKQQLDEAITEYKKAVELDPRYALARNNLGNALADKQQWDEAIAAYRIAIKLDPKYSLAHNNLGFALTAKKQVSEAIAEFRKAVELNPRYAIAHSNLGNALAENQKWDEAIAAHRAAIKLDPNNPNSHNNLGNALKKKHQLDEAISEFRKAIELNPKVANAHRNLGNALMDKQQLDEAITVYQQAIEVDPKDVNAHHNLGTGLFRKNRLDEAIAQYRKTIKLAPNDPKVHYNLGVALKDNQQLNEAVTEYRTAIELDPSFAIAYCNLGQVLQVQGHFAESLAAYHRGDELGRRRPDWRHPSAGWVRQAERLAASEEKLPAFQKGEYQPRDNEERLTLAQVCQVKQLSRAAVGLYAQAFTNDPKLADDLAASHRYRAARSAILAAGRQTEADRHNDKEPAGLRKQALDWLRADLALWTKRRADDKPEDRQAVRNTLRRWQCDPDLIAIRDPVALKKLPSEEQKVWSELWIEVVKLLNKAGE